MTFQTKFDLHIRPVIGHVPVDKGGYRMNGHGVRSTTAKGRLKTGHNIHGLTSAATNTAEMLRYITRHPCCGVQLPNIEKAEDEVMFRKHAERRLIMASPSRTSSRRDQQLHQRRVQADGPLAGTGFCDANNSQ